MYHKSVQYIFYLILFTVILDFTVGKVYDLLYFSEKSKRQDRLIHSAIGTTEDILVFGSSRAYHHYNPTIIEEKTGLSCFNVGYGGQNIYFHLALLKSAIERSKPKIAILDIISIDFEKTPSQYDKEKLGILLPFVHKSNILKETVLMRGKEENIKFLSSIYPFNSMQLHMLRNNFTSIRSDLKGFVGLQRKWDKPIERQDVKIVEYDPHKVDAFYEFIELCKTNNISLYIFISPHYVDFQGKSKYSVLIDELKSNTGVELISFENSPYFFNRSEYFADPFHLNNDGANKYSELVASIIIKNTF